MQALIDAGIAFIIALQGMGDWLVVPMKFFSYLGTEEFYLLGLPLIYWCIDSALGLRVGLILVTSNLFNASIKVLLAGPRPYWVSSHVQALWPETSFGIPSGHAQHAVSVWGIMAVYYKKAWAWWTAIGLMFLIGFSRLYLGSHFPHDVILGWLLGALILWSFARFWTPVENWVAAKTLSQKIQLSFLISLAFIFIGMTATTIRSGYEVPETWTANADLAGVERPEPVVPSGTFTSAGTFFGLAVGAAWIHFLGGYQAGGPIGKRALRYLAGLIGVILFWRGLGAILPDGDAALFYILRFLRYGLVGWWVAGGAPWFFMKTGLAERPKSI